jgi:hypothetical protein
VTPLAIPENVVEAAREEVLREIVTRPFLLAIFNGPSPQLDALIDGIARAVLQAALAEWGATEERTARWIQGPLTIPFHHDGGRSPGLGWEKEREIARIVTPWLPLGLSGGES